ncbi:hypothetical protein N7466_011499 [Penicillium verhagenii]|uniref:uncharacterized protein n=1 Tax=Penicillium verhagenii TaxID=1562060 RepID=UPI00254537D8|nr:uncharacterized protein N7466_011499 [Penicillium verhagenii]KAJ5915566.1 hypothetical protein N7466_011499 [Penicillium verhagenii]
MASSDNVSCVMPPPSQDLETYQPFSEDILRIVDDILSEDASFESSKDENWTVKSACTSDKSSSPSPVHLGPVSSQNKKRKKKSIPTANSSYSSPSPSMSSSATKAARTKKRKRVTATRKITVVEIASDAGEDSTPPSFNGDLHTEDKMELEGKGSGVEEGEEIDMEEEDLIFASVGHEKGHEILKYVISHSFFKGYVQPVLKSARCQFLADLQRTAMSAGMKIMEVEELHRYVRRIYLELADVPDATCGDSDKMAFGAEIDDTRPARMSLKRSLEQKISPSCKKSKTNASVNLTIPAQPVVQVEESQETDRAPAQAHDSSEARLLEKISSVDSMHGPEKIPESPILRPISPAKTEEQPAGPSETIDLTCEPVEEPFLSNEENGLDPDHIQDLSVSIERGLSVVSPPASPSEGSQGGFWMDAPDEGILTETPREFELEAQSGLETKPQPPSKSNSHSEPDPEPKVNSKPELEGHDQVEKDRPVSKKNKKKGKNSNGLDSQPTPELQPRPIAQPTNAPSLPSENGNERRLSQKQKKNKRKNDKRKQKRNELREKNNQENKQDNQSSKETSKPRPETPPPKMIPPQGPVLSTPLSQASNSSKRSFRRSPLPENPNDWEISD